MRVEGTYLVPVAADRVYAALLAPDTLRHAIPGCERLIQFGPAAEDGALRWEMRVRLGEAAYTVAATVTPTERPRRLAVDARAVGPGGPFALRGALDLASRDEQTVIAYVWEVNAEAPGAPDGPADTETGARFAQQVGVGLAAALRAAGGNGGEKPLSAAEVLPLLRADTARGKIVLLPPEPPEEVAARRAERWARRGAWAAAGLLAGLAAIAVAGAIIRRRGGQTG
jgi:carbon monoxide dehydrogenase subunit G